MSIVETSKETCGKYPRQFAFAGVRVQVEYEGHSIGGTVMRFDAEEPNHEIIKLDDGRFILTTECRWNRKVEL